MTHQWLAEAQLGIQAAAQSWRRPELYWPILTRLTAAHPAPLGVAHAPGLLHNAECTLDRARSAAAGPVPTIRVGSKSIRCRELIAQFAALEGFAGVFGYTLDEAIFLARHGIDDVVVGYPSVDRSALAELLSDDELCANITLMVDDPAHLELIDSVCAANARAKVQLCIDLDLSLELPGKLRAGVWRSPLRTASQVRRLAEHIAGRDGFTLVGLLGYEAQIAGVPDAPSSWPRGVTVRALQRRSRFEVVERRGAAVAAIRELTDLRFVNGGGSGSVESTAADPSVTEITVGSALTGPHLFDHYRSFQPAPATAFALDVVRQPSRGRATVLGGGWVASGPPGIDRLPKLAWPARGVFEPLEGAGEVQTPLRTHTLAVGDRAWFRHAKGGELAEHLGHYLLVDDQQILDCIPTYRGEGKAFL